MKETTTKLVRLPSTHLLAMPTEILYTIFEMVHEDFLGGRAGRITDMGSALCLALTCKMLAKIAIHLTCGNPVRDEFYDMVSLDILERLDEGWSRDKALEPCELTRIFAKNVRRPSKALRQRMESMDKSRRICTKCERFTWRILDDIDRSIKTRVQITLSADKSRGCHVKFAPGSRYNIDDYWGSGQNVAGREEREAGNQMPWRDYDIFEARLSW